MGHGILISSSCSNEIKRRKGTFRVFYQSISAFQKKNQILHTGGTEYLNVYRQQQKIIYNASPVRCHVSCVTYHMPPDTCHLSLTPKATATDAPPANSPTTHIRLVQKTPNRKNLKVQNIIEPAKKNYDWRHAHDTLFDQKSPAHREVGFPRVERHPHVHRKLKTKLAQGPIQ